MRRVRMAFVGAALAGIAVVLTPLAAQAAPTAPVPAPGADRSVLAPDGRVYAWEHPHGGGAVCWWTGNDGNWITCDPGGNLKNLASDLWNNGTPQAVDKVLFFWGQQQTGAWACLGRGDSWPDLTTGWYTFSWGSWGTPGKGDSIENNIASHRWSSTCDLPQG